MIGENDSKIHKRLTVQQEEEKRVQKLRSIFSRERERQRVQLAERWGKSRQDKIEEAKRIRYQSQENEVVVSNLLIQQEQQKDEMRRQVQAKKEQSKMAVHEFQHQKLMSVRRSIPSIVRSITSEIRDIE
jgi:hypothetical protein